MAGLPSKIYNCLIFSVQLLQYEFNPGSGGELGRGQKGEVRKGERC